MRTLIIDNPSSGSLLRKIFKNIRRVSWDRDFCYVKTKDTDEAKDIVSERKAQGTTHCGISSGDGGVGNLLNVLLPGEATLIIDPRGTSENLGNSLRRECEERYQELFERHERGDINLANYVIGADVMEVRHDESNPKFAATTTSIGLTAAVCYDVEKYYKRSILGRKFHYGRKALNKKNEFKPFKIGYSINKGEQEGTLENLFAVEIANGPHIASMPNFNPEDTLTSGSLGLFFFEDRGMGNFIELMANLKLVGNIKHITSEKDERGFNMYGVNYSRVKSVDIKILDWDNNKDYFLEMDGEAKKFNPSEAIRAEIKPKAVKYVYLPWILDMFSTDTRKFYDGR